MLYAPVLVTVASIGQHLDRCRIDLTDSELPTHPHHHEGSRAVGRHQNSPWARETSLAEAIGLVERVREPTARGARSREATRAMNDCYGTVTGAQRIFRGALPESKKTAGAWPRRLLFSNSSNCGY